MDHSLEQLVSLYQVFIIHSFLSTDVPFTNGKYIHGGWSAFYSLSRSSIQSDSGLFLIIHFIHSFFKSQKPNYLTY